MQTVNSIKNRGGAFHMILQINFNFNVPVAECQKMADSGAHAFLDVPGLRWKIWLLNPAAQEAGGIYLFDSQASLDAYLNGPLVAQLRRLNRPAEWGDASRLHNDVR